MRLDSRNIFPSGFEEYLSVYGWHFSKKLCEHACKRMMDRNANKLICYTKEEVEDLLNRYNVVLINDRGYDKVYIANMCRADYLGSSIINDEGVAKFIKDYLDDKDGYKSIAFTRYYADCIGKEEPITWEDYI